MKLAKSLFVTALSAAFLGGFAAPAFADLPKAPRDISVMDTNQNGRIEKEEYLAFMAKMFDEAAGEKGYCTFEEVAEGFRQYHEWFLP